MADCGNWFAADVATFGDRLTGAREAASLEQEELARRLGVRLTTLQAWEEDMAEPRGNRLQMLAGMLNVSLSWLMTGLGDGLPAPDEASPAPGGALVALSEVRRLRSRAEGLAQDLARVEKRLEDVLRGEVA